MNTDVGALSPPKFYLHFHPAGPMTLVEAVGLSIQDHERAAWLIQFGAVYIDQLRATEVNQIVEPANLVRVHLKPKRYVVDREAILRSVVFENEDFLVVDKPSGLPMHATLDNLNENLIAAFGVPMHVTHRLDVPTSGLVLVAKTKEYQSLFNKVVSNRAVKKIYQAVSVASVEKGSYTHFMRKSVKAPKELVTEVPATGESSQFEICQLVVRNCEGHGEFNLSTIELLTGRTHQIRAQLSYLGAPLVGDEMYGGIPYHRFGLHAHELAFTCPKLMKLLSFRSDLKAF